MSVPDDLRRQANAFDHEVVDNLEAVRHQLDAFLSGEWIPAPERLRLSALSLWRASVMAELAEGPLTERADLTAADDAVVEIAALVDDLFEQARDDPGDWLRVNGLLHRISMVAGQYRLRVLPRDWAA